MFYTRSPETPLSTTDSEFKNIVDKIRTGVEVSIYSPILTEYSPASEQEKESKEANERKQASGGPVEQEDIKPRVRKPLIIVTKKVEKGAPPIPM